MNCDPSTIACELGRIADSVSGFDVGGFLSTLLATLIGAAAASGTALWLASRERPAPVWRVQTAYDGRQEGELGLLKIRLTNVGDGVAYNVRMDVCGSMKPAWGASEDLLESGHMLTAYIWVQMDGEEDYDVKTAVHTDTRRVTMPTNAAVDIHWQQPPRRLRKRKVREKLEPPPEEE